jgi:hypothetical protein
MEAKTIEEVPNWVMANALKCPVESQISIVAKLLQHFDSDQRNQALSMSGVDGLFGFEEGYEKGYNDATKEACAEITKNYQPNDH